MTRSNNPRLFFLGVVALAAVLAPTPGLRASAELRQGVAEIVVGVPVPSVQAAYFEVFDLSDPGAWERQRQDLNRFVALKRWFEGIAKRPATERAYARAAEFPSRPTVNEETRKMLFGQTAANTER